MLTQKSKYGLKAVLLLARAANHRPVLVADIAREEQVPKKFLDQILLELKHHGVVQSRRGRGGGYLLGRAPGDISLGEIVRILDGPLAPVACVSETAYRRCRECPDEAICGVRQTMKRVRDATAAILDGTTLADANHQVATTARLRGVARSTVDRARTRSRQ